MKNAVQIETSRYALSFAGSSKFEEATMKLFKEFSARTEGEKFHGADPRPYFSMLKEYENIVGYLDKKFEWFKISTDYDDETQLDDI